MSEIRDVPPTRRDFLSNASSGLAGIALASLLQREANANTWAPPNGQPHFAPRAKSVIWLFMNGGVSHMESFDRTLRDTLTNWPSFGRCGRPTVITALRPSFTLDDTRTTVTSQRWEPGYITGLDRSTTIFRSSFPSENVNIGTSVTATILDRLTMPCRYGLTLRTLSTSVIRSGLSGPTCGT